MGNRGTPVTPWAGSQGFVIPGQLMKPGVNRAASSPRGGLWLTRAANASRVSSSPAQSSHLRFLPTPGSPRAPRPASLSASERPSESHGATRARISRERPFQPSRGGRCVFNSRWSQKERRTKAESSPPAHEVGPESHSQHPGGGGSKSPEGDADRAGGRQRLRGPEFPWRFTCGLQRFLPPGGEWKGGHLNQRRFRDAPEMRSRTALPGGGGVAAVLPKFSLSG